MNAPVFQMSNVSIDIGGPRSIMQRIASGINLELHRGRTLALVGESGCGKSVTALSAMNLLSAPLRVSEGSIVLRTEDGPQDIAGLDPSGRQMRAIRGRRIAMIFQDPMTALDPVYTVGDQISEGLRRHLGLSRREAWARAVDLLRLVGIPAPEERAGHYPFQLSGGMRQRVMIAIAIACAPSVLIADEPTTALDVTVQAQILDLLRDLGERLGMATLLITHDLGVVAENADDVIVMYRGHVVEKAGVGALFDNPAHPYTRGLMASLPPADGRRVELTPIPGQVPPITEEIQGCPFAGRCPHVMPRCGERMPALQNLSPEHSVACWLYPAVAEAVA
ncbi:ABC transporter ATP-binding protein [Microvirga pudoricolor]|uniref:ABC transporter ATP-binding protein n=1 Tax=Microvirga pudoricolor TaxID=2778729 RepID=UPI001951DB2A|nr:ABC transporter ATP-binding protein [Microvirga pudoricolor]MBM6594031.1 ABC transporter ATP-binding protein [Microvirga pudoricolor]